MERKVFLDGLPRKGKFIDWKKSIGYSVEFTYDNIFGSIKIIDSKGSNIFVKYENNDVASITKSMIHEGKISKIIGLDTSIYNFKVEIGQVFKDENRDIFITDRKVTEGKNNQKYRYYKYTCNKCGWTEGWVEENNLKKRKSGCSCCYGRTAVKGINDIETTHPQLLKYFVNIEDARNHTYGSGETAEVICPDCSRKKFVRINSLIDQGFSCACSNSTSYPNKFMLKFLSQLNIEFETEYSPDWIKPRKYDFYFELDDKKYIVEMDGDFHNKDNLMSGMTKEEMYSIDTYKDLKASENSIEMIRIDCRKSKFDWIKKKITNSNLNNLFDLNKLNWLECEAFALSNLVKTICEYSKNNPDLSTVDIGLVFKINCNRICKYLKQGTELGWCNYSAKNERMKCLAKAIMSEKKRVEVFKDGISQGIYESASYLDRNSENDFGIKFNYSGISMVCNNKRKEHKGYTFKFADNVNIQSIIN